MNIVLDDNKLNKFLELKLESLNNGIKIDIEQFKKVFKNSLELLDLNTQSQTATLAKEELTGISYENLNKENISSLKHLNEHFQNIYTIIAVKYTEEVQKPFVSSLTFAIPTIPEMFGILPMFAGKPQKLSQAITKILTKNKEERTTDEQDQIDQYLSSIFDIETEISYSEGRENIRKKGFILLCDNPIVTANAQLPENHIDNQEGLISYIKRTYGSEGLRHLLAILVGMEENGRKGICKISINEHLNRLGYKKGDNRTYKYELKKTAAEIIYILSSLYITIIKKKGKNKGSIEALKLFNLEGVKVDFDTDELINSDFYISTTEWYKQAFLSQEDESPKYTKLLKTLIHENHLHHSLTIYLTTLFGVFWRMQSFIELKVQTLIEWCDLNSSESNKHRDYKTIESELNYMKEKNYLGNWEIKSGLLSISESKTPLEENIIIYPPIWLNESIKQIEEKKEIFMIENKNQIINLDQFEEIYLKSNLTIKEFCEKIDISPRMFHLIKKGERNISNKISSKLIYHFNL
jgi:hypothetical protein